MTSTSAVAAQRQRQRKKNRLFSKEPCLYFEYMMSQITESVEGEKAISVFAHV